jgi:hypothetical protein
MISTDGQLARDLFIGPGSGFGWNQPMNRDVEYSKEQASAAIYAFGTALVDPRRYAIPFTHIDPYRHKDEYTPIHEACTE